jgi:CRP-like cAMP-binding protein
VRSYLKAAVLAAAAADPGLLLDLLERVARQLHRARTLIELRSVGSAQDRILRHLTLLADERGCVAFDRPLIDIAGELGLTHEPYYRALQRAGRLERWEGTIRLAGAGSTAAPP